MGKLILPNTFPCFLDISKANTWRTVFENSAIFNPGINGKIDKLDFYLGSPRPLSNIFYLLQVLAPGMLVIYIEYLDQLQDADMKVSKVLPRADWIESNIETMSRTDGLLAAARDRKIAFHEERTARRQNNSHNSSLPRTDAVPAAATKSQKIASKKESTDRPQNNHSSLPGTDALPATAKDSSSKTPSQKKGKGRSQNNSHHTSLPGTNAPPVAKPKDSSSKIPSQKKEKGRSQNNHGSLPGMGALPAAAPKDSSSKNPSQKKTKKGRPQNNNSYNIPRYHHSSDDYMGISESPCEYGMCDKDCGWCGRCISDFDL